MSAPWVLVLEHPLLALFLTGAVVAGSAWVWSLRRNREDDGIPAVEAEAQPAPEALPESKPFESFATRLTGDLRVGRTTRFPDGLLLKGNVIIEDGGVLDGAAEVFGNVVVGAGGRITEPLVLHGNLTLGAGAEVRASRVEGTVVLHRDAIVDGPLLCDRLHLDEGDGNPSLTAPTKPPQALRKAPNATPPRQETSIQVVTARPPGTDG